MARTSRRPLTRDRVFKAAMKVADSEGLPALSMRRLGKELRVEAMSLYYHLPGKDGLLDGLAEALASEITAAVAERPQKLTANWKVDLRSRCLTAREVVLLHPWTPSLLASRFSSREMATKKTHAKKKGPAVARRPAKKSGSKVRKRARPSPPGFLCMSIRSWGFWSPPVSVIESRIARCTRSAV